MAFGYNSANERMEIPYVRVVKPDKTVMAADNGAMQDLTPPIVRFAPIYTDYHEKHVTVPSLRPGDVLEYDVAVIIQTPLAPGQFWIQHDFQKIPIVLDEQLEISFPSGSAVKVKSKTGFDPKITDENGREIYQWTSSHLIREDQKKDSEAQKPKKKKPEDEFADVQLTTFASWEELGRWYESLERDRRTPSAAIKLKAEELTKGLQTNLEKIEVLYDYTAKNFRYVSLSLGLGRYQPHSAEDVLRNQYGDCKDKNTLFEALLDAVGIHAAPALMNSFRKLDPDVPSPSQFNHVITTVNVDNQQVWMDTTTELAPFQFLSYPLRGKQALVIPGDGVPHLAETPAEPAVPDSEIMKVDGKIDDSGTIDAQVTYQVRGDAEVLTRQIFRNTSNQQWEQILGAASSALGLGKSVTEIKFSDTQATREPFTYSYHVSKTSYLDWLKTKADLKLPFPPVNLPVADSDDLNDPEAIKLIAPDVRDYRFRLEFPAKYTARVPIPVSVKRDYAEYESLYKVDGNVFVAERKLTLTQRQLSSARAQDYGAFRQAVLSDAGQQLSLETSASAPVVPSGLKADDLVKSGNTERRSGNYALAIDLLKRAIAADPKNRNAWNDLGLAYYETRQDTEAIAAFMTQFAINPYDENSYNNLGRVYLRQRKYDEAVKWFRKQIEVVPLDRYAHRNLGITYVDMHKDAEAVPELQQAASLTPNDADIQVTLGQAYLNLGEDDKAINAFDKAVGLSPTPRIWNNVAFQLARKKTHLEVARNYAASSISTLTAQLRTLTLNQLTVRDLEWTTLLANSWDTLGWTEFMAGDLKKARDLVSAAWQLSQNGVIADHLGTICQSLHDTKAAIHYYELALVSPNPDPETRKRLGLLLHEDLNLDEITPQLKDELLAQRSITLPNAAKQSGNADFFILLNARRKGDSSVESVNFVSGDEKMRSFDTVLQGRKFLQSAPDDTQIKILRRGTLSCKDSTHDCVFVLKVPDDVRSVN